MALSQREKDAILKQLRAAKAHASSASDKVAGAGLILTPTEAQSIQNEHRQCSEILTEVITELGITLKTEG